jgi:dihydrofolate reductase
MGQVIVGMTMSLDGFVNDRNGDVGALFPNLAELRKTAILQEFIRKTGAVVMGRRAYDMAGGDFTGYEFQVPIFVLTHHLPAQAARGENDQLSFTFVTDGIESAVRQARAAAGDRDVTVIGGPNVAQQLIQAGLVDELQIGIMPVLLGDGLRFFQQINPRNIQLEKLDVVESGARTDLHFRVVKPTVTLQPTTWLDEH